LGAIADRLDVVDGFGSTEAVKRAVRANYGISIVMAASVCDEVQSGSLVILLLSRKFATKDIHQVSVDIIVPNAKSSA